MGYRLETKREKRTEVFWGGENWGAEKDTGTPAGRTKTKGKEMRGWIWGPGRWRSEGGRSERTGVWGCGQGGQQAAHSTPSQSAEVEPRQKEKGSLSRDQR